MKKILFIGDSITAAGLRIFTDKIGTGYVRLIHDYLKVSKLNNPLEIVNKGVSGDRVIDLAERWDQDVIAEQPDYVSISIGVNDVWRQLDRKLLSQVYPKEFEQVYDDLLKRIKMETEAKIILMEPTVIEEVIESEGNIKLKPYIEAIHKLADKYDATIIPTHQTFLNYLEKEGTEDLTTDGVHMTSVGNTLMAKTWLNVMDGLL